jgi:hypothetical protein
MSSIIASFFSSFVAHADAPSSEEEPAKEDSNVEAADAEVGEKDSEAVDENVAAEEPEEEEPEDVRVFNDPL